MDSLALREALTRLALNHRWTWSAPLRDLFASLAAGALDRHPIAIVADATEHQLDGMLADDRFMALVVAEEERRAGEPDPAEPVIAYFSPEFGLSDVVPQYSGGLGILAGDHLKASSDLNIPLVGVGLFYREGFFKQHIVAGQQTEQYPDMTPEELGAVDTGIVVQVPMPGREVAAKVWRMHIDRVPLLLLDTDVPENNAHDRLITDRLYSGDARHRLEQELVLGAGGTRAVHAVGYPIALYHLNEGHAGFLVLELIDRVIADGDIDAAVEAIRPSLVFTTHTPVPAGIDRFEHKMIDPYLDVWARRWGAHAQDLWPLGIDPVDDLRFNMAAMGLRAASVANGVSELHGATSRQLFAGVGIGDEIGHVTNGVHARTWVADNKQEVFDGVLGPEWAEGSAAAWERVDHLSDEAIDGLRNLGSLRLGHLLEDEVGAELDPDALIVGFARRFATYKRATLLFNQMERLEALLADDERPIHFVFAGKAHPADTPGKRLLADIVEFGSSARANGRFTFIPGYSIEVARFMYDGCDIWLNTPVRPREASGTSGEKAALNGCLNCSISDGWWAEMADGTNGWTIPTSDATDDRARDEAEAAATLDVLEEILAEYHDDRPAFLNRIRHNWRSLGPKVTAARMVADYNQQVYLPALGRAD